MFAESRYARPKVVFLNGGDHDDDHWARKMGRMTMMKERIEEGKREGDEAARTDGCCHGSANGKT